MNRLIARSIVSSLFFVTMFLLLGSVSSAASEVSSSAEFCWKDSYGRGVGTVPLTCPAGTDKIGLLCYSKCAAGQKRFGVDCHSSCPSGMKNQGLFCRNAEYGRGAGYISRKKCNRKRGNCEKTGLRFYPKCRAGYKRFGCCICRPAKPDCRALGLKPGIDLSCRKVIKLGKIKIASCPSGKYKDAGLCYKKCRTGAKGVGPVCWFNGPKGWKNCGMGAAKTSKICGSTVFGQVSSVGTLALTVATLGTSTAATGAASTATSAGKLAKLKATYSSMKKAYDAAKKSSAALRQAENAVKLGVVASKTIKAVGTAKNIVTAEDIARTAAQIAAIVDKSGVSDVIGAYTYPKCSKYYLPKELKSTSVTKRKSKTRAAIKRKCAKKFKAVKNKKKMLKRYRACVRKNSKK
jgi:hypothetical protein